MALLNENELTNVNGGAQTIKCIEYQIKRGDSLSLLASRYGTTVDMLQKLNNIHNADLISENQMIYIPYNN